jgi:fatty-acyl-CoA synthase
VAQRVRDAVGLPPEEVVLVAPGTLPKTSSGKLQRSLCRSRYLESELELV